MPFPRCLQFFSPAAPFLRHFPAAAFQTGSRFTQAYACPGNLLHKIRFTVPENKKDPLPTVGSFCRKRCEIADGSKGTAAMAALIMALPCSAAAPDKNTAGGVR
jgi:hypothetical protein